MNGLDFHGRTVWITGAGKGIGYATALAFVEAGAQVTGFDLTLAGRLTCSSRRWRSSAAKKAGRL